MFKVFALNSLIIAVTVLIHYEFLYRISLLIPLMKIRHRYRIVMGVFGGMVAHSIEIWLFAIVYYVLNREPGWGHIIGEFNGSLMDCAYFSFTTFTTLGVGDIEPHGNIRYLVGLESLTGLLLITWTASFLYYEMQRHWDKD